MFAEVFNRLLNRAPQSHKYDYGHVLVIGGSPGMVGAPLLSAKAALRTGAGLVTIASAAAVTDKLEKRVEEIMTLLLSDDQAKAASEVEAFIKERKVSVLIIGPGLSGKAGLVLDLLRSIKLPLVIDGGGLGALQDHTDQLDSSPAKSIILTPHIGEFQRLIDEKLPAERSDLKPVAVTFAKKHSLNLVLKGEPTYVAHANGSLYENTTGNPGLATAGSGDVLSGVIAGIVAQGIEADAAAEAATYLHGLAGDIAASEKTEPGMIASDIIESLPEALVRISRTIS